MQPHFVHKNVESAANQPPERQGEEGKDEGLPGLERQSLRVPGGRGRCAGCDRDEGLQEDAGKVDGHHGVGPGHGGGADGNGHDLIARCGHVELIGANVDLIGTC